MCSLTVRVPSCRIEYVCIHVTTQEKGVMTTLCRETVAKRLEISPTTVRLWLRGGKPLGVELHKVWRVKEADLQVFIERLDRIPPDSGERRFTR